MSYNKILTDAERLEYKDLIDDMYRTCTDTMSRKIEGANVQQAFVVNTILELSESRDIEILCIGSYEDTAFEYLVKKYNYNINGIDPVINLDLAEFVIRYNKQYDISFACSVIEHVERDGCFLQDMIDTIKPGGFGIITCDFDNNYVRGNRLPTTNRRFYTEKYLANNFEYRLKLNNCVLLGKPEWEGTPYQFEWEGIRYDFATFVFKKERK